MKSGPPPKETNAGARPHIVANDADARIRFTIFKNAVGRLSKKYWLKPDGSIDTDPATQLWEGSFEVVVVDASDLHRALAEVGSRIDVLSSDQAIGCGVPKDGTMTGTITTVDRHEKGLDIGAIPRSLSHFGAPPQGDYGLVLFDGDGIAGLSAILTELYPPFADAAVLIRPSASASVKDPKTGAALKVGEHLYAVLDEPALAAKCLKAVLRLAWCSGQGWVMLTTNGAMLARGPIDAAVGSLERLSYEGEAVLGKGIERLPRVSTVAGGTGVLCAADLLAYADRHAPQEKFDALFNEKKSDPALIAESEKRKAAYREKRIDEAVAQGKTREQAEAEFDRAEANSYTKDGRIFVELPPSHVLYIDGKPVTVGEILKDPAVYHKRTCADPMEGLAYKSKNCAIIYAQSPELRIYSFAHGSAFAYFAPLPSIDWSQTRLGEFLRQIRDAGNDNDSTFFTKPLPIIKYGALSEMADRAAEVLLAAAVRFYQRGNGLVRPVVLPVQTFGGKSATAAQLVEVDLYYLRDTLCQKSRWMKFDKRANKWLAAFPSADAAHVLLKRFGDWTFPALAGIITTPTLRPDGTILKDAGYDAATQLLLIDPPPMPEIPEHPTKADALAALTLLKDLMAEFPFAVDDDGVSLSVALSAQISTVCRGAYPIVPVHIVDAPAAGSGKSYLLSTVSWIATGQAMPVLGAGKNEEELGKRLDAAVLTGQPLICIDNVVGEVGGDTICRLTEQWRPQVRILGQTQIVNVDARGISFFANGNNIIVVGDFYRRVVRCRLDARSERPELRQFKRNPMDEILADRGAFIAAALTICRAYRVAERPGLLPKLASYAEWSDTVRSALVWLGEADPVKSQDKSHAEDPEAVALMTMLNEWIALFGAGEAHAVAVRNVINCCDDNTLVNGVKEYEHKGLRNAVLTVMPVQHNLKPDAQALGFWLRSKKERRIGKLRFRNKPATGHSPALWWAEEE